MTGSAAGLHLDEGEGPAAGHYEVDLDAAGTDVPGFDPVAPSFEVAGGARLSFGAEGASGVSHWAFIPDRGERRVPVPLRAANR